MKKPTTCRAEIDAKAPRTAMVMAAGLGKRMRPLTATRPKPLVMMGGQTMLDHVLDKLRAAGVEKVVVNVHYLASQVEAHLEANAKDLDVAISDEREQLLETGGGLIKAEPMIDCDPFLALNSDNYWIDGPADSIRLLASQWDDEKMDALLLMVPQSRAHNHQSRGDFHLDAHGRVSRRQSGKIAPFIFTGIQMISKRLLRDAPAGKFSTNIFWDRAIEEGRLYGAVHQGLWFDVGTPAAIPATEAAIADG